MSLAHITAPRPARATSAPAPQSSEILGDALGVDGVQRRFGRDSEIFGEGEPAEFVYRVISGVVRTGRILADGKRQISEIYLPGDVFGLQDEGLHGLSAEAVTDCTLVAMRRRALSERAAHDCRTACRLYNLSLHQLQRSQAHMLTLARKSAAERLAWFLLDMSQRIPAPTELDLPVSRQEMADYLGLTIETVSRTMTQLQADGLIKLASCRRVILKDRQRLQGLVA